MKTVLAFDFGASSGRAIKAVFDGSKITYEEMHRFENTPVEIEGHIHHDTDMIMREINTAIDKAGKVDSLAFDTWGVDYALLDENDEIIEMPYHYRDCRTGNAVEKAVKMMPESKLYSLTGNQIMNINTLFQLLCDKNLTKAKTLLFMPDLFTYLLCGNKVCERTIASTSQMLNPENGEWSEDVLNAFSIDKSIFPKLCNSGTVSGEYKEIKVISVAGHDTQSAVSAVVNSDESTAFLSCGTWSLIGCEIDRPILSDLSFKNQLSNELGANGKINFLKNISGLWLIQEVRRDYKKKGLIYSYADLEKFALESQPFKCFIDPDSPLLFSHGDLPQKIADYCKKTNQKAPENVGETVRCIYESLALKYRYSLEQIQECTNRKFSKLAIIGGGTKDGLLCQMTADCLNIDVTAGPVEATALGNIILQLIALGEIKDVDEGRKIIKNTEKIKYFKPAESKQKWNEAYNRFLKIVDKF